jgi:hypothetical protein
MMPTERQAVRVAVRVEAHQRQKLAVAVTHRQPHHRKEMQAVERQAAHHHKAALVAGAVHRQQVEIWSIRLQVQAVQELRHQ